MSIFLLRFYFKHYRPFVILICGLPLQPVKFLFHETKVVDRKFRAPRIWSNFELKKIAPYCAGDIINVSAWKDEDKEGYYYRNYFSNARSYVISNYKAEARGMQGVENEFFLDLTANLPTELMQKFDVVFNHTTLEHIFDVDKAFSNLCSMSKDLVITVVPFMQEMHGEYGDFWRFTPLCMSKLFEKNGFEMIYSNFNNDVNTSVYILTVGSRFPDTWKQKFEIIKKYGLGSRGNVIGSNLIKNNSFLHLLSRVKSQLRF